MLTTVSIPLTLYHDYHDMVWTLEWLVACSSMACAARSATGRSSAQAECAYKVCMHTYGVYVGRYFHASRGIALTLVWEPSKVGSHGHETTDERKRTVPQVVLGLDSPQQNWPIGDENAFPTTAEVSVKPWRFILGNWDTRVSCVFFTKMWNWKSIDGYRLYRGTITTSATLASSHCHSSHHVKVGQLSQNPIRE